MRAFTLIELLLVVVILSVLAIIAIPNILEAQTRARVARVHADLNAIATQAAVHGELPRLISGTSRLDTDGMTATDPFTAGPYWFFSSPPGYIHGQPPLIYSPGPSRNFTPYLGAAYNMANITYDPTNGSTSAGFIHRAVH